MNTQEIVDEVITGRHSCRAFLPRPVARETVEDILRIASRAPSGTNTVASQKVVVRLTGCVAG